MSYDSSAPKTQPKHIAIVMDGNGRWAKQRLLPRVAGHTKGVDVFRQIVKACLRRNIHYLTVFAFSSENWKRPTQEVDFLLNLLHKSLQKEVEELHQNNVKLCFAGDFSKFNEPLKQAIDDATRKTKDNNKMTVTICINYGGRWDITQACEKFYKHNPNQTITPENIAPYLSLSFAPDPDLLIRTGGEMRISNFLLWQLAYTELYFTNTFWPDFSEKDLDQAIDSFLKRERRFGQTSEQLLE